MLNKALAEVGAPDNLITTVREPSIENTNIMMKHPKIQLCICDQETMTYLRVGGTVNFTSDPDIIDRCFEASPVLTSQFGEHREAVIAYYLTDAWAEFVSFEPSLPRRTYQLVNRFDTDK